MIIICVPARAQTQVLQIWETIWTRHQSDNINLFIAVAVIEIYGLPLMKSRMSSDRVLEFFNSLALMMDLGNVLRTMRAVG